MVRIRLSSSYKFSKMSRRVNSICFRVGSVKPQYLRPRVLKRKALKSISFVSSIKNENSNKK